MGILGPPFSPFLHFLSNQDGSSEMKISSRPAFPHSHHVEKTVEKQPENFTEFLTIKWQYSAKSRQSRQYSNIYNSRSRKKMNFPDPGKFHVPQVESGIPEKAILREWNFSKWIEREERVNNG